MGNIMAGLGLALIGVILFLLADMFTKYPASSEAPPPWPYLAMKAVSYFFLGVGVMVILTGFF